VDGQAAIGIERPRSIPELIGATFDLYFRVPVLFLVLAAVVMIPWELILLLITGDGPLASGHGGFISSHLVELADYFLATPLISAFHVHAVREVGDGGRPRLIPTFRQSLSTLPVVAFATGISGTGITIGLLALAVPGILLFARWAVVAQTAALDGGAWTDALRRSADLTAGERWHAFGLLFVAGLITFVPWLGLRAAFGHQTTTIASFAAGTSLQIVMRSFGALATALLYFDLKARSSVAPAAPTPVTVTSDGRPTGWYIDPSQPKRMRYWAGDGEWSTHTAKTPKAMLRDWHERGIAEPQVPEVAKNQHTGHSLDPGVHTDEDRPPD